MHWIKCPKCKETILDCEPCPKCGHIVPTMTVKVIAEGVKE